MQALLNFFISFFGAALSFFFFCTSLPFPFLSLFLFFFLFGAVFTPLCLFFNQKCCRSKYHNMTQLKVVSQNRAQVVKKLWLLAETLCVESFGQQDMSPDLI